MATLILIAIKMEKKKQMRKIKKYLRLHAQSCDRKTVRGAEKNIKEHGCANNK